MLAYQSAVMYAHEKRLPLDDVIRKWVVDPGQGIPRKPWGMLLKHLGRRSYCYLLALDRVLDSEDPNDADNSCNRGGAGWWWWSVGEGM
jgi:hypothetical protein